MRRPASRSSTSCSTRRDRRAQACGPCRTHSTWASRSVESPKPCSPVLCRRSPPSGSQCSRSSPADRRSRRWMRRSPTTCPRHCTHPKSSPTRRASTRSSPAPRSTAGTSTRTRSRRSGAAAASSGRSSSTASPTPTTRTPTSRRCWKPPTSRMRWRRARRPGAVSWRQRHCRVCRCPGSAPR